MRFCALLSALFFLQYPRLFLPTPLYSFFSSPATAFPSGQQLNKLAGAYRLEQPPRPRAAPLLADAGAAAEGSERGHVSVFTLAIDDSGKLLGTRAHHTSASGGRPEVGSDDEGARRTRGAVHLSGAYLQNFLTHPDFESQLKAVVATGKIGQMFTPSDPSDWKISFERAESEFCACR